MLPYLSMAGLFTLVLLSCSARAAGLDVIVSPSGNDATGDGSEAHPFASAARAQTALRDSGHTAVSSVFFRAGTYELNDTLVLDARDSNTRWSTHPNDSAAGRIATLSGGTSISGWAPAIASEAARTSAPPNTLLAASIPPAVAGAFRQLWVRGTRATRARTPNVRPNETYSRGLGDGSTLHWVQALGGDEGNHGFITAAGDVDPAWAGSEAEVWAAEAWTASWHTIKRVTANHTLYFNEPASYPFSTYAVTGGRRYLLENLATFPRRGWRVVGRLRSPPHPSPPPTGRRRSVG